MQLPNTNYKDILKPAITICSLLMMVSCAVFPTSDKSNDPERRNGEPANTSQLLLNQMAQESEQLSDIQAKRSETLTKPVPKKLNIAPIMPVYDPLEDHIVSFAMVAEDLSSVLYALARSVGMNVIIEPGIVADSKPLTLSFEKVPASVVLKEILNTYDIYYEIDNNVIRIQPFQEKIFKLNFLDTEVKTSFDIGGDVLGAAETGSASGLAGTFKLTGKGGQQGNTYDVIENMIKKVMSGGGKFSLNRLSGSLYIKDTPMVIRSVSRLLNHYQEMLSRQILIEARIIEVSLSDEYRFGIDWGAILDKSAEFVEQTEAGWTVGSGFTLAHQNDTLSINLLVEMLKTFGDAKVISNPTIRSKHAKPAIISVGTSISYKKSQETTSSSTSTETSDTTTIEVSSVFDGLILGVIPFIEDDGRVSLLINPIKSDVDRTSLELVDSITLPKVYIKEMSSTIALSEGELAILGGLIDKRSSKEHSGVPFLSSVPLLGYLFKRDVEIEETRELVILLSVSLI